MATLKREAGEQHKELARKQKEADDSMTEITTTLSVSCWWRGCLLEVVLVLCYSDGDGFVDGGLKSLRG